MQSSFTFLNALRYAFMSFFANIASVTNYANSTTFAYAAKPNWLRTLISALLVFAFAQAQAQQKEANNWYFGVNAAVNFGTGSPVAVTNGVMNVWEGSATISDALGNLQFYTNGQSVWTRTHVTMPNGTGLLGDNSATQSAIIVPKPNTTNKYWIFTVDKEGGANGLRYSEVDMSLNGGLGNVTATKNVALATPVSEKITAVKKCDGSGYFILAHRWNSNQFLLYETTTTVPTPTLVSQQAIGASHSGSINNSMGYMKVSPNGRKVALAMNTSGIVELYDFDNITGVLSNLKTINTGQWAYGVEFSPNMKYLYVSVWYENGGNRMIIQYDISGATPNSTHTYNSARTIGALQLAPDGKIYYSNGDVLLGSGRLFSNNSNLGVIASPNNNGGTAGWNDNAVPLAGRKCDHGLPNFIIE